EMIIASQDSVLREPLYRLLRLLLCYDDPYFEEQQQRQPDYNHKQKCLTLKESEGISSDSLAERGNNNGHMIKNHPNVETAWTYKHGVGYSTKRLRRVFLGRLIVDILLTIHHVYLLINSLRSIEYQDEDREITFSDTLDPFYRLVRLRSHLHMMALTAIGAQMFLYGWGFRTRFLNGPRMLAAASPTDCKYVALVNQYLYLMVDSMSNEKSSLVFVSSLETENALSDLAHIASLISEHNRRLNHTHYELEPVHMLMSYNHKFGTDQSYRSQSATLIRSEQNQNDCQVPIPAIKFRFPMTNFSVTIEDSFGGYLRALELVLKYFVIPPTISLCIYAIVQGIIGIPVSGIGYYVRAVYIFITLLAFLIPLSLSITVATGTSCMAIELSSQLKLLIKALSALRHRCEIVRTLHTISYDARLHCDHQTGLENRDLSIIQYNTSSSLECIDVLAINLMLLTNGLLVKISQLDKSLNAGRAALLCWNMAIAVLTLVFLFDHYNDLTWGELLNCYGVVNLYISSLIIFSSVASVNGNIQLLEYEWNKLVSQLGYVSQRRILYNLLAFLANRETYSIRLFGRTITTRFLCLLYHIIAIQNHDAD
ncbi:hypothetical protein GZH46_00904, partial [Fragariocoptes setiger]